MKSNHDARAVWEDLFRQTHCALLYIRKSCLTFLLAGLIVYVIFTTGNALLNVYQRGAITRSSISKHETRVILLTYMRSGSTFTSELLQAHPDVFFQFEPLHTVWYFKAKAYAYLTKLRRVYFLSDMWKFTQKMKLETMYHCLRCSFQDLDIMTLLQHHWFFSKTTINYKRCTQRLGGVIGLENCVPLLTSACSQAKVNLIKTINLTVTEAEHFMQPDAKVIHLVRDPRATLLSHMKFKAFSPQHLKEYSKTFCESVLSNIREHARLKTRYPLQVAFVRYEDIAHSPLTYTQRIYDYVGLSMSKEIRNYVKSITSDKDENCPLCTSKANSSNAAEIWRQTATLDFVHAVDSSCRDLYPHIGYLPITSPEMLKDISLSLRTTPLQLKTL